VSKTTTPDSTADLFPPPAAETPEETFNRRMRAAALIRRRRRTNGLSLRQVALAVMIPADRLSRYENGTAFPGPDRLRQVVDALDRLIAEGAGDPERAATNRAEYEAADADSL
jgi:transcriptional regulator with XRE-family HTH domain